MLINRMSGFFTKEYVQGNALAINPYKTYG